jgi:hypothetical protein
MSAHQFAGEIFALVSVEHREPLDEWDCGGLISVTLGSQTLVAWDRTVGIDHSRPVLTLANIAAEARRVEREPVLGTEAALNHCAPKDQDIDSRVVTLGRRVPRHRKRRFGCHGSPRLDSAHTAGLQLSDDLVGDFLIETRPVPTGTSASG